jgi:phosphate transport system permease protein
MTSATAEALKRPEKRRQRVNRLASASVGAATVLALIPLVLMLFFLVKQGASNFSFDFFATDPTGNFIGDPGGIKSAILGTAEMVFLATAITVPLGIAVAVYLTEYGAGGKLAGVVRYLLDVMTGVPSIVFGLFVYIVLVVSNAFGSFAGWKGSVALALLMLPIIARSSEEVLKVVPSELREGALALGAPRWRVIANVVLPSAFSGLATAVLLAVARAAGETAPLLFTATIANDTTFDLGKQMNSLPALVFNDVGQAQDRLVQRAWGAALTLVVLILVLSVAARLIARRSHAHRKA